MDHPIELSARDKEILSGTTAAFAIHKAASWALQLQKTVIVQKTGTALWANLTLAKWTGRLGEVGRVDTQ
ncbi:MAG TPA: hypothetical protein PKN81_17690 [Anaerolineales bacterium]|nr:hypothetical protein [Anaerolineales bacterium]HUM28077.1 hypothetical protein [Anaerolineales bacterium]